MGGRGSSSGISDSGKPYGTEFRTVYKSGNIKFVMHNDKSVTSPLETMTRGRVYVTVAGNGKLNQIAYYDNQSKKMKTIDLGHAHDKKRPHVHHGYHHKENDGVKGYTNPTPEEKRMVDRVIELWNNRK